MGLDCFPTANTLSGLVNEHRGNSFKDLLLACFSTCLLSRLLASPQEEPNSTTKQCFKIKLVLSARFPGVTNSQNQINNDVYLDLQKCFNDGSFKKYGYDNINFYCLHSIKTDIARLSYFVVNPTQLSYQQDNSTKNAC